MYSAMALRVLWSALTLVVAVLRRRRAMVERCSLPGLQQNWADKSICYAPTVHRTPPAAPLITPLLGGAAIEALVQNVYRLSIAEYMGYKPAAFTRRPRFGR